MAPRLKFTSDPDAAKKFREIERPIANAATAAVREAAALALAKGRANIAAAGFSSRWQQSLKVRFFPRSGTSIKTTALIYTQMPFAGVFEKGVTVSGKPLLWLPLPNVPRGPGGRQMSAQEFAGRFGKLASVNRPGRRPLLFGKLPNTDRAVPLFFGLRSASIRKRFRIIEIVRDAADRVPEFYAQNVKAN